MVSSAHKHRVGVQVARANFHSDGDTLLDVLPGLLPPSNVPVIDLYLDGFVSISLSGEGRTNPFAVFKDPVSVFIRAING